MRQDSDLLAEEHHGKNYAAARREFNGFLDSNRNVYYSKPNIRSELVP